MYMPVNNSICYMLRNVIHRCSLLVLVCVLFNIRALKALVATEFRRERENVGGL